MDLGLQDVKVVVFGVLCGIGWVIVWCFVEEGVCVVLIVCNFKGLEKIVVQCCEVGSFEVQVYVVDFLLVDQIKQVLDVIGENWGLMNVFVNNVGNLIGIYGDFQLKMQEVMYVEVFDCIILGYV